MKIPVSLVLNGLSQTLDVEAYWTLQRLLRDELGEEAAVEPFATAPLEAAIRKYVADKGLKPGQVFHPLRVSVSGRTTGPSLFEMLEVLGRDRVLARLGHAAKTLASA